jgi:hypothetical protein
MMDKTKNKRLNDLLQKHISNDCSTDERLEMASLIQEMNNNELKEIHKQQWNRFSYITPLSPKRTKQILDFIIKKNNKIKICNINKRMMLVASILVFTIISISLFEKAPLTSKKITIKAENISCSQPAKYIRNVTLPDGSSVILKAGSRLYCPPIFAKNIREVTLHGEAFFDIKHNDKIPFIIKTGEIRTIVLGTAFNINSNEKNVTISVIRGKVKVNNRKETLAILALNQEFKYDKKNISANNKTNMINDNTIEWIKQGVDFNHISLFKIAQILSNRYGVDIKILSPEIANTLFVTSFSGMESLNEILDVICNLMPGMTYRIEDNTVIINQNNKE